MIDFAILYLLHVQSRLPELSPPCLWARRTGTSGSQRWQTETQTCQIYCGSAPLQSLRENWKELENILNPGTAARGLLCDYYVHFFTDCCYIISVHYYSIVFPITILGNISMAFCAFFSYLLHPRPLPPSPAGRAAGSHYTHPDSVCRPAAGSDRTQPWPWGYIQQ